MVVIVVTLVVSDCLFVCDLLHHCWVKGSPIGKGYWGPLRWQPLSFQQLRRLYPESFYRRNNERYWVLSLSPYSTFGVRICIVRIIEYWIYLFVIVCSFGVRGHRSPVAAAEARPSRHCLGYFRTVVQCRLIDRDTMRPNNKALSPRPLCINLSARWHIEDPGKQYGPTTNGCRYNGVLFMLAFKVFQFLYIFFNWHPIRCCKTRLMCLLVYSFLNIYLYLFNF